MSRKKILLLVPAESASGGIKHYYHVLKSKFNLPVEYAYRGARNWPYHESKYTEIKRMITDYRAFYKLLKSGEYGLIQTSTSFGWAALIRDGIYILLARSLGVKTMVFYRGWNDKVRVKLEKRGLNFYKRVFLKTDVTLTLSQEVKDRLIGWGYSNPIHIETTLFDESLLEGVNIDEHLGQKAKSNQTRFNILFLARIEKEKGIFEALNAVKLLQLNNSGKEIHFTIAGSGRSDEKIQGTIKELGLKNVSVLGHVSGEAKKNAYLQADCYLFPSYREGMPNSILEAMAFGLPIVSRPVGSIPEIVKKENGFLSESYEPEVFADFLQQLLDNPQLQSEMSVINSNFAKQNFYSEMVLKRLEKIYSEVLNGTTDTGA